MSDEVGNGGSNNSEGASDLLRKDQQDELNDEKDDATNESLCIALVFTDAISAGEQALAYKSYIRNNKVYKNEALHANAPVCASTEERECVCGRETKCNCDANCLRLLQENDYNSGASELYHKDWCCRKITAESMKEVSPSSTAMDLSTDPFSSSSQLYNLDNPFQTKLFELLHKTKSEIEKDPSKKEKKPARKGKEESSGEFGCTRTISCTKEFEVGTYKELKAKEVVKDNLTPHHMPATSYMKYNIKVNANSLTQEILSKYRTYTDEDGVCIHMQHQRHSLTFSYGRMAHVNQNMYYNFPPEDVVKFDIINVATIYSKYGMYNQEIRAALVSLLEMNETLFEDFFKRGKFVWKQDFDAKKNASKKV